MPRTLLVDTNRSALPIYEALVERGHQVTVVGGNPRDYLASASARYLQIDYADVEALGRLIDEERFDWVVPGCNDRSYLSCAEVNARHGYPGIDPFDVFDTINRKDRFRALAMRLGIPVPRVYAANQTELEWPLIIKPVDAFSGRGVTRLDRGDRSLLADAVAEARAASPSQSAIVEQFVQGQLYSHTSFLKEGRIATDFIVIEHGTANPFAVDTSWVMDKFPRPILQRVRDDVVRLANALGLRSGLVHTQFIANNDRYWFIEVTRRCPGDLYAQLIEFSTGFPYGSAYAAPFIGEQAQPHVPSGTQAVLRHTISGLREAVFSGLRFEHSVDIRLFVPLAKAGERLGAGPAGRIGILFLNAPGTSALEQLAQRTLRRELYTIL